MVHDFSSFTAHTWRCGLLSIDAQSKLAPTSFPCEVHLTGMRAVAQYLSSQPSRLEAAAAATLDDYTLGLGRHEEFSSAVCVTTMKPRYSLAECAIGCKLSKVGLAA